MTKLVFILMLMNGDQVEGEKVYPSMQKCSWYAKTINKESDRLAGRYSAWGTSFGWP